LNGPSIAAVAVGCFALDHGVHHRSNTCSGRYAEPSRLGLVVSERGSTFRCQDNTAARQGMSAKLFSAPILLDVAGAFVYLLASWTDKRDRAEAENREFGKVKP
jgi:hypothetical protein